MWWLWSLNEISEMKCELAPRKLSCYLTLKLHWHVFNWLFLYICPNILLYNTEVALTCLKLIVSVYLPQYSFISMVLFQANVDHESQQNHLIVWWWKYHMCFWIPVIWTVVHDCNIPVILVLLRCGNSSQWAAVPGLLYWRNQLLDSLSIFILL